MQQSTLPMTIHPLIVKLITMSINVQFFASLREQIGQSQITLPWESPLDALTVWKQATANAEMPDNTLCAINMEYVKSNAQVEDGDEIAFFPPVTGG